MHIFARWRGRRELAGDEDEVVPIQAMALLNASSHSWDRMGVGMRRVGRGRQGAVRCITNQVNTQQDRSAQREKRVRQGLLECRNQGDNYRDADDTCVA